MTFLFKKNIFLALSLCSLSLIGTAHSYKFAVVNDIHADINYVPTSPFCISKTLVPAKNETGGHKSHHSKKPAD